MPLNALFLLAQAAATQGQPAVDPSIMALIQGGSSAGIIAVLAIVVRVLFSETRAMMAQIIELQRKAATDAIESREKHIAELMTVRADHQRQMADLARDHATAVERARDNYDRKIEAVVEQRGEEMRAFVDASGQMNDALDRLGVTGGAPTTRRPSKDPRR